jgi:hypothetical protein
LVLITFILSVLFFSIGRLVREDNAETWLNGYNTMSPEERKRFDLKGYLILQRRFFGGLALGLLLIVVLSWLASSYMDPWTDGRAGTWARRWTMPCTLYWTLGGLAWFTWYYRDRLPGNKGLRWLAPSVLGAALVLVSVLMRLGDQEAPMSLDDQGLHIGGMYATHLSWDQLQAVDTVAALPPIRFKMNGFSDSYAAKGYFKTQDRAKIKVFVLHGESPILHLRSAGHCDVYYSHGSREWYRQILLRRPDLRQGDRP